MDRSLNPLNPIKIEKLDANLEQQFDLNLIEAVKVNPVIYDRSHYNYKHFVRKAQTWKQIAESLGVPEQKCTKRWKSLRDKFAREMKLCQESRWRYFKQMNFLVDSIRQYRESLLGKCAALPPPQGATGSSQVDPSQQQAQQQQVQQQQQAAQQQQQQSVVDLFTQPFNGNTTGGQQQIHPHVTGDSQLISKDQKPYFYEPPLKRERTDGDNDNMLNTLSNIKIFQNHTIQPGPGVSAEDTSFGVVVTDMLNTLGVRQKAEAKVHIIKYLTDMQLLAQHNKY